MKNTVCSILTYSFFVYSIVINVIWYNGWHLTSWISQSTLQNSQVSVRQPTRETNGSYMHHFVAIGVLKLDLESGNTQFASNSTIFRAVWPWNLTGDLEKQLGTSSMLLQALCIIWEPLVNSNLSYSPETPNLGQIRRFLEPCDLEIWRMTLKNNRAPLLSNIKLYASFHHHMWIQTWVTVRKQLSWVVTSVTLTFDFWPWSFAWTLLWSLVITPENLMMIQSWEHSQKAVTDGQTDRQTDRKYHL